MKRKKFIQLSTSPLLFPLFGRKDQAAAQPPLKNWSGNIEYSTSNVFYPASVEALQELVKKTPKLRALGTRHCFNTIADSKQALISTSKLSSAIGLDKAAGTVTVEGGIKYGELAPWLHEKGFALHNLASLPHISVAGSCATATHGSGVRNGNLTTAIRAMDIITADGSMQSLSREKDGEQFLAAAVHLGTLGIVARVTLEVQPTYMVRQLVFERMPMAAVATHFEEIVSAGYSVSLFTDWQQDYVNEVWIKSRVEGDKDFTGVPEFFGAMAAKKNLHPIAVNSAENCTEQMGVPGPWHERLPHFKMGFTPSNGAELQSEYFVPREKAVEAIQAVAKLGKQIGPHLFITEIRTIQSDNFWLSPCRHRDAVTIHFTWKPEWPAVKALLPVIEQALAPFDPRPHWGKLFTLAPQVLASRYEKMNDFKKLMRSFDPGEKFRNDFISQELF